MAKSIRSKWKRKCRAIKRERYGKKELDRLKKTLGIDKNSNGSQDVSMAEISEIANIRDQKTLSINTGEDLTDVDASKRVFNSKTLKDQHGNYPVWMHRRKIPKKKRKQNKGRKGKKQK